MQLKAFALALGRCSLWSHSLAAFPDIHSAKPPQAVDAHVTRAPTPPYSGRGGGGDWSIVLCVFEGQ